MTTVTSLWRSRDFRLVWGATGVGALGVEIAEIALPLLALVTLGASGPELAWVRAALFAPYLLLTLWLGVLVDRVRRRRLLVAADLARAGLFLAAAGLAAAGRLPLPGLVVIAALLGTLGVATMLADFSFLPAVVGEDRLADANAANSASQSAIGIGGAGVGGALVQALTAPLALAVTALTHLASAVGIAAVRAQEPEPDAPATGAAREALGGLATLVRHRVLRALAWRRPPGTWATRCCCWRSRSRWCTDAPTARWCWAASSQRRRPAPSSARPPAGHWCGDGGMGAH